MWGPEFGSSSINSWTHPAMCWQSLLVRGCNCMGNVFFSPVNRINCGLNSTDYLSIVAEHVYFFMTTIWYLLMAFSSMLIHHVTKLKASQITMSSVIFSGYPRYPICVIEHWWDVAEWETDSMKLKYLQEWFQHLVEPYHKASRLQYHNIPIM